MYIIRHVNMQHIHEIFAQLIFLPRRRHACTTVVVITTKITFVMWQTLISNLQFNMVFEVFYAQSNEQYSL